MKFGSSRSFGDLDQTSLVSLLSKISKDFFSETIWQISIKFHIQPPGKGKKVDIFSTGHMTMMATMPIYGKNLKKTSSPKPVGRCLETWYVSTWDLVL